jgi:hypothetical protein
MNGADRINYGVAARLHERDVQRVSHSNAEFRIDRTASSLTASIHFSRAERRACLVEGR